MVTMWFVGCSDRGPAATNESLVATAGSAGGGGTQVVPTSGVTDPSVTSPDQTADGGSATTTIATTTIAAATTTVAQSAEQPPPPVTGCRDAPFAATVVEIAFDDDTLRYDAAVAPPCVRVHAAQQLRVTNAAHFNSVVSVGATSQVLAMGTSVTTAALGTFHGVGDVFDVRVHVLSTSVLIQVVR